LAWLTKKISTGLRRDSDYPITLDCFTLDVYGYKVSNHECLGKLTKEFINDFDAFSFDRFRYTRNGINYYSSKVGLEEGKTMIRNIFVMRDAMTAKVRALLEKKS